MQQEIQSIPVQTIEGQIIEVDWNLLRFHSKFFSELDNDHDSSKPLKLEIQERIFTKIYAFLENHGIIGFDPIPKPIPSSDLKTFLPIEDAQFIQSIDDSDLKFFDQAAYYLQIRYINDLIKVKVAVNFFGKTIAEIQQEFGINEPFNQEQEEQMKKDYSQFLQGCNSQVDQQQ